MIAKLAVEKQDLIKKIAKMQEERVEYEKNTHEKKEKCTATETDICKLVEEIEKLSTENESKKKDRDELKIRVTELSNAKPEVSLNLNLFFTLFLFRQNVFMIKLLTKFTEAKCETLRTEIQSVESQGTEWWNKCMKMNEVKNEKSGELQMAQWNLKMKENEYKTIENESNNKDQRITSLKTMIETKKSMGKELKDKNDMCTQKNIEVVQLLRQLKLKRNDLKSIRQKIKNKKMKLKKKNEGLSLAYTFICLVNNATDIDFENDKLQALNDEIQDHLKWLQSTRESIDKVTADCKPLQVIFTQTSITNLYYKTQHIQKEDITIKLKEKKEHERHLEKCERQWKQFEEEWNTVRQKTEELKSKNIKMQEELVESDTKLQQISQEMNDALAAITKEEEKNLEIVESLHENRQKRKKTIAKQSEQTQIAHLDKMKSLNSSLVELEHAFRVAKVKMGAE
ncbi:hypothetical protein RFI_06826 [Reticulomyxa filosa]|uniref:Uncharacterized protein n=1 Tax=Reticulomyxa filosa TaxID=46433 RepID=X6NWN4_RETFI|nr:hypothetical protein RFI_06826 [Reticulomyxa filosa]|eukprot:ETO30293.1 hypothetical protein RFI_06826 [Reticulomyxa filosa]